MMSEQDIINVVAAHQEGKQIQAKDHFGHSGWQNCNPVWDFYHNDYRVAPEPPHLLKGYCFPMYIEKTPVVGMIKVEQVHLDKGENPIQPRKPREWIMAVDPSGRYITAVANASFGDTIVKVREITE